MATVYAGFDSHQGVAAAVEQLLGFGFPRSAIQYAAENTFREPPRILQPEDGLIARLGHFFSALGSADRLTVRRGGMMVAVDAATRIEEATARAVLRSAGGFDPEAFETEADAPGEPSGSAAALGADDGELPSTAGSDSAPLFVGGLPLYAQGRLSARTAASQADAGLFQDSTLEVRELAEALVVTKQARVIEEIKVRKAVTVYNETIATSVRRTAIEVERMPPEQATGATPAIGSTLATGGATPLSRSPQEGGS